MGGHCPLALQEWWEDLEVLGYPTAFIQAELGTWSSRYGAFNGFLLLILSLVRGELRTSSYGALKDAATQGWREHVLTKLCSWCEAWRDLYLGSLGGSHHELLFSLWLFLSGY